MLEWCHRFAHDLAVAGIGTVVPDWPGTGDSEGNVNEVTLDRLVQAGLDGPLPERHVGEVQFRGPRLM